MKLSNQKTLRKVEEALYSFEEQMKTAEKFTAANQHPAQREISEAEKKLEAAWEKFFDEAQAFIGEVQQKRYKVLDDLAALKKEGYYA